MPEKEINIVSLIKGRLLKKRGERFPTYRRGDASLTPPRGDGFLPDVGWDIGGDFFASFCKNIVRRGRESLLGGGSLSIGGPRSLSKGGGEIDQ